jgi:hypothetical protein
MDHLRGDGIQSSIHYPPIHHFSYYLQEYPGIMLPRTEQFCARELSLPLHPSLTENDVERVVESLRKGIGSGKTSTLRHSGEACPGTPKSGSQSPGVVPTKVGY